MTYETVWQFNTKRLSVSLRVSPAQNYQYDGDDESGEVQEKLDSGEYVAFESAVIVELDGKEIAADYLGGSVYAWNNVHEFWTAHRDRDPMNRNCSIMRAAWSAKTGGQNNVGIGHYFPDMVRTACKEARAYLAGLRQLRLRTA
jgi:hypothetical protein